MTTLQAASAWLSQSTAPLVRVIRWAVFALLLYLIAAVNAIIVLRVIFRLSLPWIMDSAQLVAPWLAVFAAADAFAHGAHPGMEFLLTKLTAPRQRGVRILIQVLTLVVLGLLGVVSWNYAQMGRAITITSMDFLTMFPFYLSLPVGFGCMFLISLERTLRLMAFGGPDPREG
jgi:TRAP-type C4-dicarboxylate transport system permease small subunit